MGLFSAVCSALAAEAPAPATRLKIAVVQMAQATTMAANRDRIVGHIAQVAAGGARVAVFPENVLMGEGEDDPAQVEEGVAAIRKAAREHTVYVLFGGRSWFPPQQRVTYWLYVIGPDGRDLLRYDKLFDQPQAPKPKVFAIEHRLGKTAATVSPSTARFRASRGHQPPPIADGPARAFPEWCCVSATKSGLKPREQPRDWIMWSLTC